MLLIHFFFTLQCLNRIPEGRSRRRAKGVLGGNSSLFSCPALLFLEAAQADTEAIEFYFDNNWSQAQRNQIQRTVLIVHLQGLQKERGALLAKHWQYIEKEKRKMNGKSFSKEKRVLVQSF